MPRSILFMKLTDPGIKDIKTSPQQIEQGIKTFETMGGKMIGFYTVLGEYDYVAIGEGLSDKVLMTFVLVLGSLGNIRMATFKVFTKEEFAEAVKKLP